MEPDLLDNYSRASAWAATLVPAAASKLGEPTRCDGWDVRTLLNHMLDTQRYFLEAARGKDAQLPSPTPPELIAGDPVGAFTRARADVLEAYGAPGVVEKTGPALGIAFADQLVHGWDLAAATGQDETMPAQLAEAAYKMIHGRFTEEQRVGVFKPEVPVASGASAQDVLLGYTGRDPAA